jgi:hypothetical protein
MTTLSAGVHTNVKLLSRWQARDQIFYSPHDCITVQIERTRGRKESIISIRSWQHCLQESTLKENYYHIDKSGTSYFHLASPQAVGYPRSLALKNTWTKGEYKYVHDNTVCKSQLMANYCHAGKPGTSYSNHRNTTSQVSNVENTHDRKENYHTNTFMTTLSAGVD